MTTDQINMISEMTEFIREAAEVTDQMSPDQRMILQNDTAMSIRVVNRILFGYSTILIKDTDFPDAENHADITARNIFAWLAIVSEVKQKRAECSNRFDQRFYQIIDCAKHVSRTCMLEHCKNLFFQKEEKEQSLMSMYYRRFHYFWGTLDPQNNNFETMEQRIDMLKARWQDFLWLYQSLQDYRSKHVLIRFLDYWLTFSVDCVRDIKEHCFSDYFDLDILPLGRDEVFVDLGAYNGDTILDYAKSYGDYKKIYAFEMSEENVKKLLENTSGMHDIEVINKAVGEKNGTISVNIDDMESTVNTVVNHCSSSGTNREIEMVTVDDVIKDRITLIKMDIEGAEKDAIKGCARHIHEEQPKLLISVYHNNEDIWKIPEMIHEMDDSYRFYLRSNGNQWGPSEIVLFAV